MKRLKLTTSWWRPGKDLDTFGLVKFFSLPGFVVILVFTVILTVLLTLRAQQMALKKNEDYLILLAANLNHQIYQQFVLPTAFEKGGPHHPVRPGAIPASGRGGAQHHPRLSRGAAEPVRPGRGVFLQHRQLAPGEKMRRCRGGEEGPGRGELFRVARLQPLLEHLLAPQLPGARTSRPTSPSAWKRSCSPIRVRWWGSSRSPRISPGTWRKSATSGSSSWSPWW